MQRPFLLRLMLTTALLILVVSPLLVASATATASAEISADQANDQQSSTTLASIHFQPDAAPTPAGFAKDSGLPFDAARGYGWVLESSLGGAIHTPVDVSANTRVRQRPGIDPLLDSVLLMQPAGDEPAITPVKAAWEYALPNGIYSVTVSVGDAPDSAGIYTSSHTISVENVLALSQFRATAAEEYRQANVQTIVADKRLTISAVGGSDTRINYVIIARLAATADRPTITGLTTDQNLVLSSDYEAGAVPRNPILIASLHIPTAGALVDWETLIPENVTLLRASDNTSVPVNLNTSANGTQLTLTPRLLLDENTRYIFRCSEGLKDTAGAAFLPFEVFFTTSTGGASIGRRIAFDTLPLSNTLRKSYTTLAIGPDNKLYAGTLNGDLIRFTINSNGMLTDAQLINTVVDANAGQERILVGFAFDPAATADNPILWVNHSNALLDPLQWSGKLSRLSGPNLEEYQDYVVGLPRSANDHLNNGIAFDPKNPDQLYILMGAMTAMGGADSTWGMRHENLLSAALLKLDLRKVNAPPLDVKTAEGGSYDPYASDAPLTIYATGIRNAYDLVWHSNGNLYVPNNGSARGGTVDATSLELPESCKNRIDKATKGAFTGPASASIQPVKEVEDDFLYRVVEGGYYGHPNPSRCEWVLNGGNPTAGKDPGEISEYPQGTLPDRNYRGFAFNFDRNRSPNGVIEYLSDSFEGGLKGKLLITRFNQRRDIIVLTPNGPNGDISEQLTKAPGMTGFGQPLDLIEDTRNGNLYVAEFGLGRISLLRPTSNPGAIRINGKVALIKQLLPGMLFGAVVFAVGIFGYHSSDRFNALVLRIFAAARALLARLFNALVLRVFAAARALLARLRWRPRLQA